MASSAIQSVTISLSNVYRKSLFAMDSLLAVALGLGLRVILDIVGRNDIRVEGSLVGLWEGLVLYHFLEKWPRSYDPYVGFGFRLFIDFLFTENLARMIVIVLWTGVGMIMSDIGPALWQSTGLRRLYRHLSHDLALFGFPGLPFFTKNTNSRVRFTSPSRASSAQSPNAAPDDALDATPIPLRSRPLPGSFPGDAETETEPSVLGSSDDSGTASATFDIVHPTGSEMTTENDEDTEERTPTANNVELSPEIPDEDDYLYSDEPLTSGYPTPVNEAPPAIGPSFPLRVLSPPVSPRADNQRPLLDDPVLPDKQEEIDEQKPVVYRYSMPETEFAAESVISGDDPDDIIGKATELRSKAEAEERERKRCEDELKNAKNERRGKDALMLRHAVAEHATNAERLNKRAARRFHHGMLINFSPSPYEKLTGYSKLTTSIAPRK